MPVNLVTGNDAGNTLQGGADQDLIYGYDPNGPQATVTSIAATRVATGLAQPLFACAPPGDTSRLFVVEKGGLIKILDLESGTVRGTPFLNLTGQIATSGEQGLLGLAFDPAFASNGIFYVNLINPAGDTEIRRYQVSAGDPNQANPGSASLVITVDQPAGLTNHKAGWLGFGPDGYLYAALGDGGGSGDPGNNGQNLNSLLGKILRLDPRSDAFPGDAQRNYAIPADNPFVNATGADEIWALGLRNPWRVSFDRGLGTFWIADVGQNTWEEINLGAAGANYGWKLFEGPDVFSAGTPSGGTLTAPIHVYDHNVGNSITGGYVYRGPSEGLQGQYFFADFVDGKIFTLRHDGSTWVATDRTAQIGPNLGAVNSPASFGEDGRGTLYLVDLDGDIFALTPTLASADQADTLDGFGGNDMLHGGSGNDTLRGGTGDDAMLGGRGDDIYAVDSLADVVVEMAGEGTADYVATLVTGYTLAANVERGQIAMTTGATLTGNGLNNVLIGGSGNDSLRGAAGADGLIAQGGNDMLDGGAGNDAMAGGLGDDVYLVDSLSDRVMENAGEGASDYVAVAVSGYTLAAEVERGQAAMAAGGALTGNGLANILVGSGGADVLNGAAGADGLIGGAGSDMLTGGADNDTFGFVLGQANGDTIVDFTGNGAAAGDKLHFVGYGPGATFTNIDPTHWQVNYNGGASHDVITFSNAAAIHASDVMFF
jgi:glucose/arabinose dehydrogenase